MELADSADGASGLYAPTSEDAYNDSIVEHTALRSASGRSIVLSYSRPIEAVRGDVRLARITLR